MQLACSAGLHWATGNSVNLFRESIRFMVEDLVAAHLRLAFRAALARHEADRAAGRETDGVRVLAERFLALLADKPASGAGVVTDMGLRATVAASIMAEVEAFERSGD